ncbi:hypothetical protein GGR54DRAFT_434621 [Hypoxylon sp. NC1633]|nr:hypothetical protein GGR54DRAFT_434621 [Hypoxylon sp. NC1633]
MGGKKWTLAEDTVLRNEAQSFKEDETVSWTQIARSLPGRSNKDCRKRWHKINGRQHRGTWSEAEDTKLRQAVERLGTRWTAVSDVVGTRTPDRTWLLHSNIAHEYLSTSADRPALGRIECHKRWQNTLNPVLDRYTWAQADDDCLLAAVMLHGRNWSSISREYFPARSPLELSNKYASLCHTRHRQVSTGTVQQRPEERYADFAESSLFTQPGGSTQPGADSHHDSSAELTFGCTQVYTSVGCPDTPTSMDSSYTDLGYFTNVESGVFDQSPGSMNEPTQYNRTNLIRFRSGLIASPSLPDHHITPPSVPAINNPAPDSVGTLSGIQSLIETGFEMPYFSLGSHGHSDQQEAIPSVLEPDSMPSKTRTSSSSMMRCELSAWQPIQVQPNSRPNMGQGYRQPTYIHASGSTEQGPGLEATQGTVSKQRERALLHRTCGIC